MVTKILVIVGGNKAKIESFAVAGAAIGVEVTTASFSEVNYNSSSSEFELKVRELNLKNFDAIYIRMVGRRLEEATLVANYARKHDIKVYDTLYANSLLMPSSLGKTIEMMKLIEAKVSLPKTFFGSLTQIEANAEGVLGFPFVVKSTTGKKSRQVWSPETREELAQLFTKLTLKEKEGLKFFAQELIPASERIRVFVLGGKALAAIVRPTKWRKRFGKLEGRTTTLNPIPAEDAALAEAAAKATELEIAGVDIIHDDKTGKAFVLEANAAPVWKALSHDTGKNIEEEILRFISNPIS